MISFKTEKHNAIAHNDAQIVSKSYGVGIVSHYLLGKVFHNVIDTARVLCYDGADRGNNG